MSEDNVYVRSGNRSRMTADIDFSENHDRDLKGWDFEEEVYDISPREAEGNVVCMEGVRAFLSEFCDIRGLRSVDLAWHTPRLPIDDPESLLTLFPAVIEYPDRTLYILGFDNFHEDRETGYRRARMYVAVTPDYPHFTAVPDNKVHLSQRYFLMKETTLPEWIPQG